ncbi:aldo/keto reductase [Fluviispira vulneris]|uniref:aldo/keto reductase n=1 Tax=Fluviispira vulneris TaxID=2763012 RepID=UPI00164857D0|nr:aldo/keto reductase [Fluviispira vulneris]
MALLPGYATAINTKPSKNSLGRFFESRRRTLYKGGPSVTPVGFGSYRIGMSKGLGYPECGNALELALKKGLNLIDTSTNYGGGQSEMLIGKTLKKLISENIILRENIVVVSKVGYIQGSNIELAKAKELQGNGFKEISKFGEETWHCIHPDFILDQVERSRSRLGLETIDVYLLHNPEYMLKKFELEKMEQQEALTVFYSRIRESFLTLEKLVSEGKIRAYGISSNNLGAPQEEYSSVSIKKMHEIALSISPEHNFRVVQMPMNWLEVSPAFYDVEEIGESTLSYAQKNNIGVMLNRPFNAMFNDGLIRLTRPQISQEDYEKLDDGMKKGLENWTQLSSDLERLAKEQLADVPGYDDATLSQFVVSTLAWVPGVTSVLCGIRKEKYVDDVEQALARPSLPRAREHLRGIYENLEFKC